MKFNAKIQPLQASLGLVADGIRGPVTTAEILVAADEGRLTARAAPTAPVAPITSSLILQGSARVPVTGIVVHCSATRWDWMAEAGLPAKKAEIRRWHMDGNGWSDIGYHWLIDRDGSMVAGRKETTIGAHVKEANRGTIGICLIGGHGSAETDAFSDHFTAAQDRQLRQLILGISMRTRITRVSGHNEWAAKACPGFNVPRWLEM
jgi:hypothetical protein